jgi:hypothetical protein
VAMSPSFVAPSWSALCLLLPVEVLDEQTEQLEVRAVRSFYLFATSYRN